MKERKERKGESHLPLSSQLPPLIMAIPAEEREKQGVMCCSHYVQLVCSVVMYLCRCCSFVLNMYDQFFVCSIRKEANSDT